MSDSYPVKQSVVNMGDGFFGALFQYVDENRAALTEDQIRTCDDLGEILARIGSMPVCPVCDCSLCACREGDGEEDDDDE